MAQPSPTTATATGRTTRDPRVTFSCDITSSLIFLLLLLFLQLPPPPPFSTLHSIYKHVPYLASKYSAPIPLSWDLRCRDQHDLFARAPFPFPWLVLLGPSGFFLCRFSSSSSLSLFSSCLIYNPSFHGLRGCPPPTLPFSGKTALHSFSSPPPHPLPAGTLLPSRLACLDPPVSLPLRNAYMIV